MDRTQEKYRFIRGSHLYDIVLTLCMASMHQRNGTTILNMISRDIHSPGFPIQEQFCTPDCSQVCDEYYRLNDHCSIQCHGLFCHFEQRLFSLREISRSGRGIIHLSTLCHRLSEGFVIVHQVHFHSGLRQGNYQGRGATELQESHRAPVDFYWIFGILLGSTERIYISR